MWRGINDDDDDYDDDDDDADEADACMDACQRRTF
jgi:hypothetical protein